MLSGNISSMQYSYNRKGHIRERFRYWDRDIESIHRNRSEAISNFSRARASLITRAAEHGDNLQQVYRSCSRRRRVRDWHRFNMCVWMCARVYWRFSTPAKSHYANHSFFVYRQRFFLAAVLFALFKSKSADCGFFR